MINKKIVLVIAIILCFTSCGNNNTRSNPYNDDSKISSTARVLGEDALEVIDGFLDEKTTSSSATKKLNKILSKFPSDEEESIINTCISLCSFVIDDFDSEYNSISDEKLKIKLLIERNELSDRLGEEYREIVVDKSPIKVNLRELAINHSIYDGEYITTTIDIEDKTGGALFWYYEFEVDGLDSDFNHIMFYPNGYPVYCPKESMTTITGVFDDDSYNDNLNFTITGINSDSVSKEADKSLYYNLNKLNVEDFPTKEDETDDYYSYYDNYGLD